MAPAPKNTISHARSAAIYLLEIIILAIVYHLAARLGLKMAYVQVNTSPVWPPTGIALAALLIFGIRLWPGIALAVLLGSLLTGAPFGTAFGMTIGNTLEAVVGAYCLQRFIRFHNSIDRIQDVVGLALFAVLSTTISASIGTTTLMLTGSGSWEAFGSIWLTWWIGDLLGALVVTPVLLTWATVPSFRVNRKGYIEGGILLVLLALGTRYVFSNQPPAGVFHQAMIYVIFPFMIWAALRLGQRGATTAVFLVSGVAIWGTSQGLGPFSLESKNDSLVLLQTFMGVVSLTSLILAATTVERRMATEALRQRVDDLATLNDSSKIFLDASDIASIYQTICELAVTRLGLDAAWLEMNGQTALDAKPTAIHGIAPGVIVTLMQQWEKEPLQQDPVEPHIRILNRTDDMAYRSSAAFPLVFSSRHIGMLKLMSTDPSFFTQDRQLLIQSYANLAAVAIQNTWLFDEVRKANQQLHALTQRLMKAQEEERLNLSRELHDESGQLLAALMVELGMLERDIDHPAIVRERIIELSRTANKIQDNLHKLAVNLRPASLDHLGLVKTLQQFVDEFSRQYRLKVEFEAVGMQEKRLPIEVETALFRIVQESLTNVVTHAHATHVDVLISRNKNRIGTVIEDDGVGFIPTSFPIEDHLGLFGMRERIEMLGGTFTIESSPGKGTTVKAEVPCDD